GRNAALPRRPRSSRVRSPALGSSGDRSEMSSPGSPSGSLPAASQLSGEPRPRLAVTCFKEGEIAVHFLARKILPCPGEFQERASRSGEPPHDLAEALSLPLEGGQGGICILGECHRLHRHTCVDINTRI